MSVNEAPPTFKSRPIQQKRRYFSKSIFSQATATATGWKKGTTNDMTVGTADSINRIFLDLLCSVLHALAHSFEQSSCIGVGRNATAPNL
jgi:hypothetical protein